MQDYFDIIVAESVISLQPVSVLFIGGLVPVSPFRIGREVGEKSS